LCAFVEALHSPELLANVRLSPTAFTRNRKLPFPTVLTLLLAGLTRSVQAELDRLFGTLAESPHTCPKVSAQAFSKARKGISAKVFNRLNQSLLRLVDAHLKVPR